MDDGVQVNTMDQNMVEDYWDIQAGEAPKTRPKSRKSNDKKSKVVILGIGQGGYNFGRKISKDNYDVTLITPSEHFLDIPSFRVNQDGTVYYTYRKVQVRSFEDLNCRQA